MKSRPGIQMMRLAAALGAAFSLLLLGTPAAVGSDPAGIAGKKQDLTPAEASSYWTPERMRNAVQLDSPGTAAALAAGAEAPAGVAKASAGGGASTRAAPTDQETFPGADTLYPQRIHGKLFVRINGRGAGCSATVVTSFSSDVILTAGHCLVNAGPLPGQVTFSTDVAFVPGYRNGAAPFGVWPATQLRAPGPWAFEGDISLDIGVANLLAINGVPIQELLGSRGVVFNKPVRSFNGTTFGIFGYPGEPAQFYDGRRLIFCSSQYAGLEPGSGSMLAAPCNQQQGSSGGAWLLGNGQLASLVSHGGCPVASTLCTLTAGTYLGDLPFQTWAAAGGGIPSGLKKKLKRCHKHRKRSKQQRCISRAETFQPVVR